MSRLLPTPYSVPMPRFFFHTTLGGLSAILHPLLLCLHSKPDRQAPNMSWDGSQKVVNPFTICARAIHFGPLPHAQASSDPSYPRTQQTRPTANAMTSLPQSQHAGLLHRLARTRKPRRPPPFPSRAARTPKLVPPAAARFRNAVTVLAALIPRRRCSVRRTFAPPLGTVFEAPHHFLLAPNTLIQLLTHSQAVPRSSRDSAASTDSHQ
ncbi:hypothetical protein B0H15DRAFT_846769 [Mycena belliarum]|uniref:Uncharacterized protein n=1 Tax=Mycena belliarum TaxID=1033014 RepID=A0AAD6XMQ6_9AGAR|nr:hypothetical protein B0H15DRAFT_846769 [Mycena belliae]